MGVRRAVTIEDLRRLAIARWPRFVGDYVERGGGDGAGVLSNVEAFSRLRFLPRALVDVTPASTETSIFGRRYACPFGISAVGTSAIYRRHADLLLAEAAREANLPFILSGVSSSTIEQVVRVAPANTWSQLYGAKEPVQTDRLVRRYCDAGVSVLVFTVDTPVRQFSEVAARSGISLASGVTLKTLPRTALDVVAHPAWAWEYVRGGAGHVAELAGLRAGRIRCTRRRSLLLRALVGQPDMAGPGPRAKAVAGKARGERPGASRRRASRAASRRGCGDGLQPRRQQAGSHARQHRGSSRSGRTCRRQRAVFFDGGIRRGSDIVMAAALGAQFSFVGRATLYGVGAGGLEGALRAIEILQRGVAYTMAMIGCKAVSDIGPGHVAAAA